MIEFKEGDVSGRKGQPENFSYSATELPKSTITGISQFPSDEKLASSAVTIRKGVANEPVLGGAKSQIASPVVLINVEGQGSMAIVSINGSQDGSKEPVQHRTGENGDLPGPPVLSDAPGGGDPPTRFPPESTFPEDEGRPIRLSTEIIDDISVPPIVRKVNDATQRASDAIARGVPDSEIVSDITFEDDAEYERVLDSDAMLPVRQQFFWNFLVRTLGRTNYVPPQDRQTVVLDLACGDGESDSVLKSYLGGSTFGVENDNVQLTGVDINLSAIRKAEANNPADRYIHGDASRLDDYSQVPDEADVVLVRHQNISSDRVLDQEVWAPIFYEGMSRLREGGIMMVTSYSQIEHQRAVDAIHMVNQLIEQGGSRYAYEFVLNERNEYSEVMRSTTFIPEDNHVLIIEKRQRQPQREAEQSSS